MTHNFLFWCFFALFNSLLMSNAFADSQQDIKQAIEKNDFPTAIIHLKNQLQEEPRNAQLRFLLGDLYLKTGQIKAGLKELGRAHRFAPEDTNILFRYVDVLQISNEPQKIIKLLKKSFTDKKHESMRLSYLANAQMTQQNLSDAQRLFEQSNLIIKNIVAYNGLATLAIVEQEYDQAEQLLNEAAMIEKDNVKTLHIKAKFANIKRKPEEALSIYNQLINTHNSNLNYYMERAVTFTLLKKNKLAKDDLKIILDKVPLHPKANYVKAQILLQEQDYKGAKDAAQNVINVLPKQMPATFILGAANFALKNYNQAEEYLTIYLSNIPGNLKARNLLANVYLAKNETEQSLLILEDVSSDELENNPLLMLTFASAYLQTNEYPKSIDMLKKALLIAPDNNEIKLRLASTYFKSGDLESSITELEQLTESDSPNSLTKEKKTQSNYLLITAYIKKKDFAKADEKLKKLLKITPDDTKLLNFQALVQQIKGDFKNSIIKYQEVLAKDKKNIPAYMSLARIYVVQKKWQKAIENFEQVIQIDPKQIKPYLGLATIAEQQGDSKKAEGYFEDALEQNKEDTSTTLVIANLLSQWYQSQKQPEKILTLAEKVVKLEHNNSDLLSFLAKAQLLNKEYELAERTLSKIVRYNRQDIQHRIVLAELIAKDSKRIDEALVLLTEAQRIDAKYLTSYTTQIKLLIKQKNHAKAIKVAQKIQDKLPELSTGLLLEAEIYYQQKKYSRSLKLYQEAYEQHVNEQVLSAIVKTLIQLDQREQAITLLTDEVSKNPDSINNTFQLASLLHEQKQIKQAEMYYQKILDINPEHVISLNNIAWIKIEHDKEEAVKLAKSAYQLDPKTPSIIDTYGYFLVLNEQYSSGIKLLKEAIEKNPLDNDIQYHLAFAYEKTGKQKKALEILKKIVNNDSVFQEKDKAQKLYDSIK